MRFTFLTDFKVYNTILLTIGTILYGRSLEHVHLALVKLYTHLLGTLSHFSFSCVPANHVLFSTFMSLSILDISCKWNHAKYALTHFSDKLIT